MKEKYTQHALRPGLCGDNLLSSWRCHQRGLSIANHLVSIDDLTKTTNTHEHIAEYNHTKRNPTKRWYATNTCKTILGKINRTHRRSRSLDLLTPRRSPNNALLLHTHLQCTAKGSSWGFPSLSLTIKGSWIHLGGGSPSLSSALWRQYRLNNPVTKWWTTRDFVQQKDKKW